MKFYAILILLCCLGSSSYAQLRLEGTIKESGSGLPLQYVNIGVVGKNMGTVSGREGRFSLNIPQSSVNDTVRISMLGYSPQLHKVSDLIEELSDKEISMRPVTYELPVVVIGNKRLKEKILGNTTESQTNTMGFTSNRLGNEVGIIIKIRNSPSFIKSFAASVVSSDNKPVKLRLNFYSVKNGMPDQLIHNKNIIVTAPVKSGKLEIDLQQYNIVAEDDFFVSLEWIENDSGKIKFSSSILKGAFIARQTSQAAWEKVGMFGIGFTVKVAY